MNIGVGVMPSVASRQNTGLKLNKSNSQILPKREETINAITEFSNNNTIPNERKGINS
jgi:hypothetical protein